MSYLSLDHRIVYAFLLITLVIGLRVGRGIKDMREYVLANRSFGSIALAITYLATNIAGASIFHTVAMVFADGAIRVVALLALFFVFLFRAFFVAPRVASFPDCLTMGDLMETFYGRTSKIIAGLLGLLTAFCIATMELSMLGEVSASLLGWNKSWTIILGGTLLALYAAYGGIKSVTAADVFKFLFLLIAIPVITILTMEEAGGMQAVFSQVPSEKVQILNHPHFMDYLALVLVWLLPLGMINPAEMQRMLMGRKSKELRDAYLIVAVFDPALQLTLLLIGLSGVVLYPHIEPLKLMPHIVDHLMPIGFKGLVIAGLLGVVMSTIDSYFHAIGFTVVHDVAKPLLGNRWSNLREVKYTRYTTFLLSLGAIFTSLYTNTTNFLAFLLLSLEFTGPLLMFPIIAGILGFKGHKKAFYIASATTLLTFVFTKNWIFTGQGHFVALTSTLVNGFTFLGVHLYEAIHEVHPTAGSSNRIWNAQQRHWIGQLKGLVPSRQSMMSYSKNKVDKYGAPYVLCGLFCCLNYVFPYFMWGHGFKIFYQIMLDLRLVGVTLCGFLLVIDKWPQSLLPYLPTFWHLTLLYCLPFMGTVMFLLTQGSVEWLINVALTIMFLIVLVDWMSFIILTVLGVVLGFVFYQLAIGPINLQLDFNTGYLLVYTCVFSTLIALLFSRRREQHLEAKLREITEHYHTGGQPGAHAHPATLRIANMIDHQVQESIARYSLPLSNTDHAQQPKEFHTATDCLHYFFPTALAVIQQGDLMTQQLIEEIKTSYIDPQGSLLSLQACITAIVETYQSKHPQDLQVDLTEDYRVYTSFNHLQYVIIHVLRFLHAHYLEDEVRLWITHQQGIHIRLPGQALSPSLLHELFVLFPAKETAKHPGLAISKLLVEAHGGRLLYATSTLAKAPYTEFIIALPPAEQPLSTGMDLR